MVLLNSRVRLAVSLILGSTPAWGGPGGAHVVHGDATITTEGKSTTITNTPGTIINWEQFSVAPDEITRFIQQSASSTVLNRVTGSATSEILGQLVSNGRVFLINPNGIAIGAGAHIDTAGFVASSLNISDADFLSGRERFAGSGQEGRVINNGRVETRAGGNVYLIAPNVENHGVITAPGGQILLAAGHSAELVSSDSPNLRVRITAAEGGEALNVGALVAKAGSIGLFGAAVQAGGTLDASSASVNARGEIVLSAGGDAIVSEGARLDAGNVAGRGGSILVEGNRVAVLDGANLDASGATGGGEIRVGGDYLGANPQVRNAVATVIAPTATLAADALESGDGGRVIAWSNDYTNFSGSITARGGAAGGDGGFVETSSANNLQALGSVDASAPAGAPGEWLLDPYNLTISSAATSGGAFGGGNPNIFTPTANNAVANNGTIQTSLNGGTSVTVTTGAAGAQAGTITVNNAIAKTAGGAATLTLNAASTITFAAGATVTSTVGALGFTLISGAAINNLPNISLNGGTLTLSNATTGTQAGVISGTGGLIKSGAGSFTLSTVNTFSGAVDVQGGTLAFGTGTNRLTGNNAVTLAAGTTLALNNQSQAIGSLTGNGIVTLGSGILTVGSNNVSTSYGGVASGTGGLAKAGTGTLTLTGANTYTGATTVNAGTLQLGGAERIADTSALTVAGGATFNLNGNTETLASLAGAGAITLGAVPATVLATAGTAATVFSGVISGSGSYTKSGTGNQSLAGANTYTGATTINAGTATLGANNALPTTTAVTMTGGTFALAGFNQTVASLAGAAGAVTLGAGTLTTGDSTATAFSGVISGTGGLTKNGTGTFTIGGVNTYTGATTINAGTLQISAADRIANTSPVTINASGTLALNNFAETLGALNGSGAINLGSGTLTVGSGNANGAFSGVISGTGAVTKTGTGTFTASGANTYSGLTTVGGGTLIAASNQALGSTAGTTTVSNTATLQISNAAVGTEAVTINGTGVGAGGALTGNGTASLAGNVTLASASSLGTTGAASNLALGGTVNGAFALTFAGAGPVALNGVIGGVSPLASITQGTTPLTIGTTAVTTTGAQNYSNALTLGADTTLTSTASGAITLANVTGAGFDITASTGGLTTLNNLSGVDALTTNAAGTVSINGNVLANSVSIGEAAPTACGTIGNGAGAVSFTGALLLCNTTTVAGTNVTFNSTVNSTGGNRVLTVNSSGATLFNGLVGNTSALASLATDAAGTTTFATGAATVTTTGAQTYNDAVLLSAAAAAQARTFASTASGAIAFNGTVDGAGAGTANLTVNTAGQTTFGGAVGATTALNTITTDAAGTLSITAPSIRTVGVQAYNDAATQSGSTTFTTTNSTVTFAAATSSSGTINFNTGTGAVTASNAGNDLGTVGATSAGNITLRDANALNMAATTSSGTVSLTTGGAITQTGAIVAPTLTIPSAGAVTLNNAGNDVNSLTSAASTSLGFNDVDDLSITGVTSTGTASIQSAGALTIAGNLSAAQLTLASTGSDVVLGAGRTLTGTGGGSAIVLSAGARFINNGATLNVGAGRWVIYSANPALNTFGGLNSGNVGVWGSTLGSLAPALVPAGNRYVFGTGQTLTFTSTSLAKTYGNDATAATAAAWTVSGFNSSTYGGVILADNAASTFSGSPSVTSLGAPATALVAGSPYTVTAATGSLAALTGYSLAFNSAGTLTVGQRALTVVADPGTKVYGNADPVLTYVPTGLVNGDTLSGALSRAAGETVLGGPYAISQGTLTNANYAITFTGNNFTITPRPITVVADALSKVYGNADPALTYVATGMVGADTLGGALTRVAGETVLGGPYAISQGTLANSNYSIAYTGANFTITPRGITVVADPGTKIYGDADPALTYVATGLLGADSLSGSLTRVAGEAVLSGPYAINQGTLANSNYSISYTSNNFTITPRGITVVADPGTKVYGDADPALTYVATGLLGADTLSGSLARLAGETVLGGPYAINQGTLGNTNYSITYTGANFVITARPITVVADALSKVYGDADPMLTYVASGLVGADTLSGALTRALGETVLGGPYAISQGALANSNYTIAYTGANFSITPRGITVVADPGTKIYGNADPALTYVATGLLGADSLSGSLTRTAGETVLGSPYSILQGSLDNPNYAIAYTGNSFTITPRGISVVADPGTKVYGDADPTLTYVATGLLGADTLGGSLTRVAGETVLGGPYAINQGTLANSNYTIAYTGNNFVITPRPITVAADPGTKVYGDVDPALTYVATGLLGADTLGGAPTRAAGETVLGGPYAISQGTLANSNYAISYTGNNFTITSRPITVVANAGTKVYGNADPALTYVATGLLGADTLSGALSRTGGETVLGSPYSILQGTLANSNYSITYTGANFSITPRPLTVTANPGTKQYGDPDPALTYLALGLLSGDTLSGSLTRTPGETVAGSPYSILQGSLSNSNYTITYNGANFVITPRTVFVVANNRTKVYGNADPALTYVATGLLPGDMLSGTLIRRAGESVALGPYTILRGTVDNPNYIVSYTPGMFTITRRPVTVVADDKTKFMGGPDPALTYVSSNVVAGETLLGALTRSPGETVRHSPYDILQGTVTDASNPNYAITYVPAHLTIEPGAVSPFSSVVEVALERAETQPFMPSCLAPPEAEDLGSTLDEAQKRLDRAGDPERSTRHASASCVTQAN